MGPGGFRQSLGIPYSLYDWRENSCLRETGENSTVSTKPGGKMRGELEQPLYGIDSNVFLAVTIPESTRAGKKEVEGSERLLSALHDGRIRGVTSSIVFAELRWVFDRERKGGFPIVQAPLQETLRGKLQIVDVDPHLAMLGADYRYRYYSRTNQFSYHDGLILATAVIHQASVLVSTDPHLLKVTELKGIEVIAPSAFRSQVEA